MWTYIHTDELYHHGIKGMKWGVRRFQKKDGSLTSAGRKRYDETKAAMKSAKKEYNKSFDKAYNRSIAALSPIKKHRQANDERWDDAANKAVEYRKAKKAYKAAKEARNRDIDNARREIDKKSTTFDKLMFSDGTRRVAAKYVADNNMTVDAAYKKAKGEALANSAAFLADYAINQMKINRYVSKHPNTKLSDAEILKRIG